MTAFASIVGAGFEGCMLTAAAGHQIVIADDDDLLVLDDGDCLQLPFHSGAVTLVAEGRTRVRAVSSHNATSIYVEPLEAACDGCAVEGDLIALSFPACLRHANSYPLCPDHGGEWAPFQCRRCGP